MLRTAAVLLTLCLAACGMRGPLVLPPGPPPEPLFDSLRSPPAPAPAPSTSGAGDVSTDPKTRTQ